MNGGIIDDATKSQQPAAFAFSRWHDARTSLPKLTKPWRNAHHLMCVSAATDERWVHDSDPQSNEGLFKQCLPLVSQELELGFIEKRSQYAEVAIEAINERLNQQLPTRFNAVLLGMGADGHIASLFPGAPMQEDLNCLAAVHPQTHQTRISLSLPRLLQTEKSGLVITGNEKRQVLENALTTSLPITNLLKQAQCKIEVFWCP